MATIGDDVVAAIAGWICVCGSSVCSMSYGMRVKYEGKVRLKSEK